MVVPISMKINEGPQYRLGTITLAGDVLMGKEDFQKQSLLHPGDIAQEDKLRNTLTWWPSRIAPRDTYARVFRQTPPTIPDLRRPSITLSGSLPATCSTWGN